MRRNNPICGLVFEALLRFDKICPEIMYPIVVPKFQTRLYDPESNDFSIMSILTLLLASPNLATNCFDSKGILYLINERSHEIKELCLRCLPVVSKLFRQLIADGDNSAIAIFSEICKYTYSDSRNLRMTSINALLDFLSYGRYVRKLHKQLDEIVSAIPLIFLCFENVDNYSVDGFDELIELIISFIKVTEVNEQQAAKMSKKLYPLLVRPTIISRNSI
jgi:hypothetical protein